MICSLIEKRSLNLARVLQTRVGLSDHPGLTVYLADWQLSWIYTNFPPLIPPHGYPLSKVSDID